MNIFDSKYDRLDADIDVRVDRELPDNGIPGADDIPGRVDLVVEPETSCMRFMNTPTTKEEMPYCPIIKVASNTYHVYLIGAIVDVYEYINFMNLLQDVSKDDTIKVFIDSPGGYIASGGIIASLIDSCKGTVITVARGICASAAALIHSSAKGDNVRVSEYAVMMYHMSSHGDIGNSMGIANRAHNQVEYVEKVLLKKALDDGHISEADLKAIKAGKEIFVSAHEFHNGRDSDDPDILSAFTESYGNMYLTDKDEENLNKQPPVDDDDLLKDTYLGIGLDDLNVDGTEIVDNTEIHTENHGYVPKSFTSEVPPMFMTQKTIEEMNTAKGMFGKVLPKITQVSENEYRIYMEAGLMFTPGYIAALSAFLDNRTDNQIVRFILGVRMADFSAHAVGAILSSMRNCKAKIITMAEGYCSVTETMIWVNGHVRQAGRYGALSFNIMSMVDQCPAYNQYFNVFLDKSKKIGVITEAEHEEIKSSRRELLIMGSKIKYNDEQA